MTAQTQIDFYKADHRSQYPEGTELVFSNLTPRKSRVEGSEEIVFFGLQYYMQSYLIESWNRDFFWQEKDVVCRNYRVMMADAGLDIDVSHLEELHDMQYLPIEIWALPEGSVVPVGVPPMVIWNTEPEQAWLTNYLETSLSATLWGMCTSATTARLYRKIIEDGHKRAGSSGEGVGFQGHDFSMRGMFGLEAAAMSGAGHLLSFNGTDTVPAIGLLRKYYDVDEPIGGSVPATEHSVMCMGGDQDEAETFRRLITEVYPDGIVSIVSDTWDYWKVWTELLPSMHNEITAREGKVVIRPDSGDPVKIICGDPDAEPGSPEFKGTFELAWELFGGETNEAGFRSLDEHIGVIYGDSITLQRCQAIIDGLIAKKFVPDTVFGIGAFTYQFVTRDTYGFAMKATYGEIDGEPKEIFKDPATDDGTKKSARGLLAVYKDQLGNFTLSQQVGFGDVMDCEYYQAFSYGEIVAAKPKLSWMRSRVVKGVL